MRSSAVAARFGAETPDLKALAAEADVDRVVMGTLLRSGDQLRAAAQLIEAPGGTLLTSHTVQSSMGDLFRLQDDIARRVSEALSLPLSGEPYSPPDAPTPARMSSTSAATSSRVPTTGFRARGICIGAASNWIHALPPRGRSWAAATA